MNKSQAEDVSIRAAEAHSARAADSEDASRIYARVHKAVFNQAFEFIPKDAVAAVIDHQGEPPKLVALDGKKLYTLIVGDLTQDLIGTATSCRLVTVDPEQASVECETKFIGHRVNDQPMGRETTWNFSLNGTELTIETLTAPDRNWLEPNEVFAQALAKALGWSLPDSKSGQLSSAA